MAKLSRNFERKNEKVSNIKKYQISKSIKYQNVSNIKKYQILKCIKYEKVSNIKKYQISRSIKYQNGANLKDRTNKVEKKNLKLKIHDYLLTIQTIINKTMSRLL